MFGSFSDPKPRHAQPCTVPEALLSAVCLCHHRQCMCVRVCVRVCFSQPQNKTQFDLLQWPVKLGCEAAPLFIPLMVSLSPLLLLNLPQTPVMCTLVNIHIYSTLEEGEEGNTEQMKERQTNCRVLEENWWIL